MEKIPGEWTGNTDAVVVPLREFREVLEYYQCALRADEKGYVRYFSTKTGYEHLEVAYFPV